MASMEKNVVYSLRGRIVQQSISSEELGGKGVKRRKPVSIAYEDEKESTSASSKTSFPEAGHTLVEKTEMTSSRRPKRCVTLQETISFSRIYYIYISTSNGAKGLLALFM